METPMTQTIAEFPVERLSIPDRLDLLARLWDSLLGDDHLPPMPDWHRDEVASRIAMADANPGSSIPLEALRKELLEERR